MVDPTVNSILPGGLSGRIGEVGRGGLGPFSSSASVLLFWVGLGRRSHSKSKIVWLRGLEVSMIKWIIILLIVAAAASLLGMPALAGAAATGARILIGVVLIIFLLIVLGVFAVT